MDEDLKMTDSDQTKVEERDPRADQRRDDLYEDDRKSDHRSSKRDRHSRSRSRSPRRRPDSRERDRDRDRSSRYRRRSFSRSRSRSRSPDHRGGHRSSRRDRSRDRYRGGGGGGGTSRSAGGPINASHEEAVEFAKISKRENRVYVGNLAYDVKFGDLKDFMRGAGEVLFAEVLVTPTGVSKGCGIVEYATREEAQRSIKELAEQHLLGRPVFIREDRETESRFGATPVPGKMGMALAHGGGLTGHNPYGGPRALPPSSGAGNQLYIGNLPYQAGWQDLKDLFRAAGAIVRADINVSPDGRAKGSGTVIFETAKDAQSAISQFNGYEWYGRALEVREDRFAGLTGGFRGRGGPRGAPRGLGRGRGGPRGGGMGGGEGRSFNDDMYAPYEGPDGATRSASGGGGGGSGFGGAASSGAPVYGGAAREYPTGDPSQQIMVRNLPWSTANEDLIDLFETTGTVEIAEILFSGTRSMGSGVVQFTTVEESETAIAKFQGYVYGGRPLDVRFNDRWHEFTPTAAQGTHLTAGTSAAAAAAPVA